MLIKFLLIFAIACTPSFSQSSPPSLKGKIVRHVITGFPNPDRWIFVTEDGDYRPLWSRDTVEQKDPEQISGSYEETIDPVDPTKLITKFNGKTVVYDFKSFSNSEWQSFTVYEPYSRAGSYNVSNRGYVVDGKTCITGFVTQGKGWKLYLIRAVGPSLSQFGVDATDSSSFSLYDGDKMSAFGFEFRSGELRELFKLAGAFPSAPGTTERFCVVELLEGTYTIVANGGPKSGDILVEVYELGFGFNVGKSTE